VRNNVAKSAAVSFLIMMDLLCWDAALKAARRASLNLPAPLSALAVAQSVRWPT